MIVVAALILDEHGRALMTQRVLSAQCPGMWEYPGGKVDLAEDPIAALVRELREEIDVTVLPKYKVTTFALSFGRPFEFWLYHCDITQGTPRLCEGQLAIDYVHPADAVKKLACCPSTYVSYNAVIAYIANLRRCNVPGNTAPTKCTHGVTFDSDAATGLGPREVRRRWPRLQGACPLGCGFSGIAYANTRHYVVGDW